MSTVSMYLCGLFFGVAIAISIYPHVAENPAPAPVDWSLAAACVWERWDSGAALGQQERMLQFCIEVYPEVTP